MIRGLAIFLFVLGVISLVFQNPAISGNVVGSLGNSDILSVSGLILIIIGSILYISTSEKFQEISDEATRKHEKDAARVAGIEKFILKLANATNLNDAQAVRAIRGQLKEIEKSPGMSKYFPGVFTEVDPDNHYAQTKQLDETAKRRLKRAVESYTPE